MTSIYINALELEEEDVLFTKRRVNNSWSVKGLERTAQQPTDYSIDFNIYNEDRYAIVGALIAETKECERILLDGSETSKYFYGNKQTVWLSQSNIGINEGGGKRLVGNISGLVDIDIIHTCDFLTNWECEAGNMVELSTTVHEGKHSILTNVDNPGASPARTTYTPVETIDLSAKKYIRFWFYSTEDSTDTTLALELHSASGYYTWTDLAYTTSLWSCIECIIADSSISGSPSLSAIESVKIATLKTPPGAYTYNLDGICAY